MSKFTDTRDEFFRVICKTAQREFSITTFKFYMKAHGFDKVCLYCGGELSGRRRSYCCDLCAINFQTQYVFTHSWQTIRNEYIENHPDCERCGKKAVEVHHRTPTKKYRSIGIQGDVFDEDNLESLCTDCHVEAARELAEDMTVTKYIRSRKETPLEDFIEAP